jgi:hypothetical protein
MAFNSDSTTAAWGATATNRNLGYNNLTNTYGEDADILQLTSDFIVPTTITSNLAQTVSAAYILTKMIVATQASGGSLNYTLDTGANMDANTLLDTYMGIEWTIINLSGGGNDIEVVASAGHTVTGEMTVSAGTSARFFSRKTTADTFVTYRIA